MEGESGEQVNVWRSIEQCIINASIGERRAPLKARISAEGGQFEHIL